MGSAQPARPEIALYDRQSTHRLDLESLLARARAATPLCLAETGPGPRPLENLTEVEVSFVDDAEISRVHEEFMNIPGATDVITFDHGEIVISADTADRCVKEHGHPIDRELTLYIIHGLLHLNGHEDATAEGSRRMRQIQERILGAVAPV